MEIVVTGRNVEVPEHFRVHVAEKVERLERYDHKIVGLEVELFHERNRRQLKNCQRVEITGRGCGPVARAEACAQDFYSALDAAIAKLEAAAASLPRPAPHHRAPLDRAGRPRWRPDDAARRATGRRRRPGPATPRDGAWTPTSTAPSTDWLNGSGRRRAPWTTPAAGRRRRDSTSTVPARSSGARCTPRTR